MNLLGVRVSDDSGHWPRAWPSEAHSSKSSSSTLSRSPRHQASPSRRPSLQRYDKTKHVSRMTKTAGATRARSPTQDRARPRRRTRRLLTGKTPLVIEQKGSQVVYRYDPTRPEGRRRAGRSTTSFSASNGRALIRSATEERQGSRAPVHAYIDFLIPGLIGLNTMVRGPLGDRLPPGQLSDGQAARVLRCANPMPRRDFC